MGGGVLMNYISAFCGIGKLRIEECERRVIDYVLSTNLVCVVFVFLAEVIGIGKGAKEGWREKDLNMVEHCGTWLFSLTGRDFLSS